MTNIVGMLQLAANSSSSHYEVGDDSTRVSCGLLRDAVSEIERLRAEIAGLRQVAGCVDVPLKTFSDIKKEIKHG